MSNVLYFFTTTLNLGNILSSAAVYPPCFYGSIPFIYKTDYAFQEEKNSSALLLYKEFPVFKINSLESNHAPLVLEISREILREELLEEHPKFFSYSGEIFLKPEAVRFIFFDDDSKKESLERIKKNLVCKFDHLFDFDVFTPKSSALRELNSIVEGSSFGLTLPQKDRLEELERLRGFCFGLALGKNLKKSIDLTKILSSAKKINQKINGERDLDKRLTSAEAKEIQEAFENILLIIGRHDAIISDFLKFENEISPEIQAFFEKRSGKKLDWELFKLCVPDAEDKYENFPDILNADQKTIGALQVEYSTFREFLTPFYEKLKRGSIPPKELDLSKSFGLYEEMCSVSEQLEQKEDLRKTSKLLQLLVFFLKKKIVGEVGWSSSRERKTCENFKQFCIGRMDLFDFQEVEDSIRGAFLLAQKPDDQLDTLMSKMEDAVVADPSVPLAMWGYLNGFLAFPKTVMHKITDNHSKVEGLFRDYEEYFSKFLSKKNRNLRSVEIDLISDQTKIKGLMERQRSRAREECEAEARRVSNKGSEGDNSVTKPTRKRGSKNTSQTARVNSDTSSRRATKGKRESEEKVRLELTELRSTENECENLQAAAILEDAKRLNVRKFGESAVFKADLTEEIDSIGEKSVVGEASALGSSHRPDVERRGFLKVEIRKTPLLSFANSKTLLLPRIVDKSIIASEGPMAARNSKSLPKAVKKTHSSKVINSSKDSKNTLAQSEVRKKERKSDKSTEVSQLSFDLDG